MFTQSSRLAAALLALAASFAAAPGLAQDAPQPIGDYEFVDSGRGAIYARFGATLATADMHDTGPNLGSPYTPTHVDGAMGYLAFDWLFGLARIGEASGLLMVLGMGLDGGGTLGRSGGDQALGDFQFNADATAAMGWRQTFGIETYLYGWLGYRFAVNGAIMRLEDDLGSRLWHLAYLHLGFVWELLAIDGGIGVGAGGLHFHVGPRLWLFDSLWVGAEVAAWITPGERELWEGRAFFEIRQE